MENGIHKTPQREITIPQDKVEHLQNGLTNVRKELADSKYVKEAIIALAAEGLSSAIES